MTNGIQNTEPNHVLYELNIDSDKGLSELPENSTSHLCANPTNYKNLESSFEEKPSPRKAVKSFSNDKNI